MTRPHATHPPEPRPPGGALTTRAPGARIGSAAAATRERHAPRRAATAVTQERHVQRRAALRLLLTFLAALASLATAQGSWEPHGDLEVITYEVTPGETAKVYVEFDPGFDFDPEVRWGDGTVSFVDRFSWSGVELEHAYTTTGLMTVEFWLAGFGDAYLLDTDFIYVRPEPELDVDPPSVMVGETVTVTVTGGPEGGRLEWGDGEFEALGGFEVEEYQHAYDAPGVYLIKMLDWGGATLVTAPVTVTSSQLVFDLDPFGQVGEPVTVRIEGLEGNAPDGARLDWGDGTVEVIDGDGEYEHTYSVAATFVVTLRRLPDDQLLAQDATSLGAHGVLDVPGLVTLFEPATVSASDLAPGLTYRIDYGDGTFDLLVADASGTVETEHRFDLARDRFTVTLRLAESGQSLQLDSRVVLAELPAPTETIEATATPLPEDGRFEITVTATGLIPGLQYEVHSPDLGLVLLSPSGVGTAEGTIEAFQEGEFVFTLGAYVQTSGGLQTQPRATAAVSTAWERGDETLALEHVFDEVLSGEVITVVASGLVPAYGYDLVVNGVVDDPYRLRIGEVPGLPEQGVWRVDMPVELFGPDVTLDLYARMPDPFEPVLGRAELRDSVAFSVMTPGGALALETEVVPYLVLTPVHVSELTPGLPYRLELPDQRVERFEGPEDGQVTFEHRFAGSFPVELYVDVPGLDSQPVATVTPHGITYGGALRHSYDLQHYLDTGEVTMHVRGAAPQHVHVVTFNDGRRFEVETDENGDADVVVTEPGVETYLFVQAHGGEPFIVQDRITLPPRVISFHGSDNWRVRVTRLDPLPGSGWQEDGTFVPPFSPQDVSGEGELTNFVVGGRLQEPVPMRFEHLRLAGGAVVQGQAHLAVDSQPADLPLAVMGVTVTFSDVVLGTVGQQPGISGTVTLPTGESSHFSQVLMPAPSPTDGFMITVTGKGPGAQVGSTPWRYGIGQTGAMLDLHTSMDYDLMRPDGRTAMAHAYAAYDEVGKPNPANAGGSWVGVLYFDGEASLAGAALDGGDLTFKGDLAWTSAGVSGYLTGQLGDGSGEFQLLGWEFTDVKGLELLFVDSQLVRFNRPNGKVYLPFFGEDVAVAFEPYGAKWRVRTLAPVARDYGSTAVVGGVGTFVQVAMDKMVLRFPNALWALDGDLAAEPSTIDTSAGDALMSSLPGVTDIEEDVAQLYEDSVATAETALNLYQLQLLLKDLTLHPDGAIDLGGKDWRTLAKVPALDMFGFPYLGAGAEIGVKREGTTYAIGLRGDLRLADVLQAKAAPSWYYHQDGAETRWAFEGVGVKFGDFPESPVTFSLVVGGVVDLQRLALSFTGAGSLTLPDVVSVEALGLFGVIETSGPLPDTFWFVTAGVDLANMGKPINVNVQGVDVLAFYAFRGGIASKLRIDVGGGDCRVDDADVPNLRLPTIATNALECYDPDLPVSFLAGTLIGSPVQGGAVSDLYGKVWHLDANLVLNLGKGGDMQLAGAGWIGKNLSEGYRQRSTVPPQIAGRFVVNSGGIYGSLCAGPQTYAVEGIDCSNLSQAEIREAGILIARFKGTIEFKASWSTAEYYFALGRQTAPLSAYVIPRETQGYLVVGYITKPGFLHSNVSLPAGGFWVGGQSGFAWDWSDSGSAVLCDYAVWASAGFGFGGALGVQMYPSFQLSAGLNAYGYARAGGTICGASESIGVTVKAAGRLSAPSPTEFRGDFELKLELPVIPDIEVTIKNVGVTLN